MHTTERECRSCVVEGCLDAVNQGPGGETAFPQESSVLTRRYVLFGLPLLGLWWLIYRSLEPLAKLLTYRLLNLPVGHHLSSAVEFFLFEAPKVLMLLTLVVFGVGIARSFFTPERTRKILAGRRESVGNVLAAVLGIVTPFCSCSAVPLFIGFVTAGIPLGVTFSFLVSAPMINEIALVLLYGLFGWKVAGIYLATGLMVAMVAGWTIGRLKMEAHLEDWVLEMQEEDAEFLEERKAWAERIQYGLDAVRDIVGKVWIYVILGIAVGAGIHGYVPEGFMAAVMGKGAWWSVPVAVVIGIPMYANAAGIIPVVARPSRKRGRPGDGAGLHDVGDRPVPAGSRHLAQGAQTHADRNLLWGRWTGDPGCGLSFQFVDLTVTTGRLL